MPGNLVSTGTPGHEIRVSYAITEKHRLFFLASNKSPLHHSFQTNQKFVFCLFVLVERQVTSQNAQTEFGDKWSWNCFYVASWSLRFFCSMLCLEQEIPDHMSLPESPSKRTDSTTYTTPAATTKSAPTRCVSPYSVQMCVLLKTWAENSCVQLLKIQQNFTPESCVFVSHQWMHRSTKKLVLESYLKTFTAVKHKYRGKVPVQRNLFRKLILRPNSWSTFTETIGTRLRFTVAARRTLLGTPVTPPRPWTWATGAARKLASSRAC